MVTLHGTTSLQVIIYGEKFLVRRLRNPDQVLTIPQTAGAEISKITCSALCPSKRLLVICDSVPQVTLWKIPEARFASPVLLFLAALGKEAEHVAFTQDKQKVMMMDIDGNIRELSTDDLSKTLSLLRMESSQGREDITRNNCESTPASLVSVSRLLNEMSIGESGSNPYKITSIDFCGDLLVSGDTEGNVRIWEQTREVSMRNIQNDLPSETSHKEGNITKFGEIPLTKSQEVVTVKSALANHFLVRGVGQSCLLLYEISVDVKPVIVIKQVLNVDCQFIDFDFDSSSASLLILRKDENRVIIDFLKLSGSELSKYDSYCFSVIGAEVLD